MPREVIAMTCKRCALPGRTGHVPRVCNCGMAPAVIAEGNVQAYKFAAVDDDEEYEWPEQLDYMPGDEDD